ncbi:MAG: hypothetical protein HKM06_04375 [Spirochaetales bacterium]|nr:hypothetical protein [Spirochaetales bacterium]
MKKMLPLILVGALAMGCATTQNSAPSAPAAAAPAAAAAAETGGIQLEPVPASIAAYAAKVGVLNIVKGAPVPKMPGVTVTKNSDGNAIVTWMTRIPGAEIQLMGEYEGWKPDLGLVLDKVSVGNNRFVHVISFLVKPTATIIYKYMVNGNWTEDAMAPVFFF